MSGDSSQPLKKKEEENSFVLERPKGPIATAASDAIVSDTQDTKQPNPGVQDIIDYDEDKEDKKCAGDTELNKSDKDEKSQGNDSATSQPESKCDSKDGDNDKVDSVYLRPPPPHKARSNVSSTDEESCGIKCLYYTLLCCDCVLM